MSIKDDHFVELTKLLVVCNYCSGLTNSNYTELSQLYEKYKDQGFEILAFPCNQFGGQEPGTNEEIVQFACTRFKAEYPIFDKVNLCTILPFLYGCLKLKETIISFSLHYESSMNNHYHLLTKSNPTCVFYFYAAFDNSELTVGYHTNFCCTSNQLSFLYEMEQGEKHVGLIFFLKIASGFVVRIFSTYLLELSIQEASS
jgi:glutathione peroxidase-family protein